MRWLAVSGLLAAFVAVLLVNGFVHSEFAVDARVAPPTTAHDVPRQILDGGPVIDTTNGHARSYPVPRKTVVLTFDDGPDPRWTPQVLRVLQKYQVPATFFVVGTLVARYPDLVRDIHESGGEIGIHTFTHPDLAFASPWRQRAELSQTQVAVAGAAGVTSTVVRPPYSSAADAVDDNSWPTIQRVGDRGYLTVLTTLDTEDWKRPGVDTIVRNGIPRRGHGEIILLHDAGGDRAQTVAALDRLIPRLLRDGYRFRTVADLVDQPTANPPATAAEHLRGTLLIGAVQIATTVVTVFAIALIAVGVLLLVRLGVMLAIAGRETRRRGDRGRCAEPLLDDPVSVVVPAYNERACIADTVRSLVDGVHPIEVIVVDDGSVDGTADIVESLQLPNVTVLRQTNQGKAVALNTGIAHASYDLVVMIDGDTVFERDTVRRLIQPFTDPHVGAVAGNAKVLNRNRLIGLWQHIEYVIGFNIDRRVYAALGCMPTIPGVIGAYRRQTLLQVDGVSDETLAEDTDLALAIGRAGWQVVYEDRARAWTEAPATLGQLWRQRYRWSYGTIQSIWKHRHALTEQGPSARVGRIGLVSLAVFQVVLPVLAPLVDLFLLYGLFFLEPVITTILWSAGMTVQLIGGVYAFRLDRERLAPLVLLPLQQVVYRQLMYLVIIQSVVTAVTGGRMRWTKIRRTGGLGPILAEMRTEYARR